MNTFENKMKTFKVNWTNNKSNRDYLRCNHKLNYIFDQKLEGINEDGKNSLKVTSTTKLFFVIKEPLICN